MPGVSVPPFPALLLRYVVLLFEQVSLNLSMLQLLQVSFCVSVSRGIPPTVFPLCLTPQMSAFLQMIHTLLVVALAHLLTDQSRHHALHPLLPDYRVLCSLERLVVIVVYAIECGRDSGFRGFERIGLWGWHGCGGRARP